MFRLSLWLNVVDTFSRVTTHGKFKIPFIGIQLKFEWYMQQSNKKQFNHYKKCDIKYVYYGAVV